MKETFFYLSKILGIFALFRFFNRKKVLVLTYHSVVSSDVKERGGFEFRNCVSQHQFEQQISFLKKKYRVPSPGKPPLAEPSSFWITFDDGFENNYLYAFPLLRKKVVPGIFFITTGYIGKRDLLWTEKIIYLILNTKRVSIELEGLGIFPLGSRKERIFACDRIRAVLKKSDSNRVLEVLKNIESLLDDVSIENVPPERYAFLTWEQINEMADGGMLIGSHTINHFLLSSLNDELLSLELKGSKQDIETRTGKACDCFSYPNGAKGDFSDRDMRILKETGYLYAFSQIAGLNESNTEPFAVKRISVTAQMSIVAFEANTCGFVNFLKCLGTCYPKQPQKNISSPDRPEVL